MRRALAPEIERSRTHGEPGSGPLGAFSLVCPLSGRRLEVMASDGRDWGLPVEPPTAAELAELPPALRELVSKKFAGGPIKFEPPAWEHVSLRVHPYGMPRWEEMCWVKEQFWEATEWVVQFHPAVADYVNDHERVLHLWRVVGIEFPHPPREAV